MCICLVVFFVSEVVLDCLCSCFLSFLIFSFFLLSVVPVALLANAARIVVTAILFQHFTEEAAHKFSHDVAGWLMIPLAAAMLGDVQWYLACLMQEVGVGEIGDTIKKKLV